MPRIKKTADTIEAPDLGRKRLTTDSRTTAKPVGLPKRAAGVAHKPFFEFMFHPERWAWNETYGWYPELAEFSHRIGQSNMAAPGAVSGGIQQARATVQQRGWTIITYGDHRLGEFAEYLDEYPIIGGGVCRVPVWVSPVVVGNRVRWTTDHEKRKRFFTVLRASGIIPDVDPAVVAWKVEKQAATVARVERDLWQAPNHPLIPARLEAQRRILAGMQGDDEDAAIKQAREFAAQAKRNADHAKEAQANG